MNIRFKVSDFEFEMQNVDVTRVDRALNGLFLLIANGALIDSVHVNNDNAEMIPERITSLATFLQAYNEDFPGVEERPVNSKRNFVEAVNGVREVNGTKLYQCSYQCSCGNKGKRYIKVDAERATCHKCNADLDVQRAVNSKELMHDDEFNYFVAY